MADHHVQREDEIARVALLPHLAIDARFHSYPGPRINLVRHHRAYRTKCVEAFRSRPLAIFVLQIARRHVVHARIAKNELPNVRIRRRLVTSLAYHYAEFSLVIDSLGNSGTPDRSSRREQSRSRLEKNQRLF